MTAIAACAIAPWLAAIFRIGAGDTDDAPTGRLQRCLTAIEKPLLRLAGVWPTREMTAREYGVAIVVFHVAGFGLLLAILRLQEILPWNPDGTTAVPWLIALNTAASFTTNTNWQSYGGETTLSPLSQALGLTVQNFVSAASGLCVLAVLTRGLVFISLLIVVTSSLWFGRRIGILAVVLAALLIDFFFVPPFFTFVIASTTDIVSLVLLLSVGLLVAELMVRLKAQTTLAVAREHRTSRLLEHSQGLSTALHADAAAATLADSVAAVTGAQIVEVLLTDATGGLQRAACVGAALSLQAEQGTVAWAHEVGRPAGPGTDALPGATVTAMPIRQAGEALGILACGFDPPRPLSRDEKDVVTSLISQTAATLTSLRKR
ncbi:MAG: potassium-transporting ATPase subunit KdpA [Planctomycetota bacterium]